MFGRQPKSQADDIKGLARTLLTYAIREGVTALKFVPEADELALHCEYKTAASQYEWRASTKIDPQYHQALLRCWREMLGHTNQFALDFEEKKFHFSLHYIVEGEWDEDILILHFKPQDRWEKICR